MLVLFLWLTLSVCTAIRLNSNIVYNPVSYPKNNFNLTIGSLFDAFLSGAVDFRNIHIFGELCAVYKYNTGRGQFKTGGTLFLEGSNTVYNDTKTYFEAMQLLQTTLSSSNATIEEELMTRYKGPVASVIGGTSFSAIFSVVPYFEDFLVPSLIYADATQAPDSGSIKTINLPNPSFATFSSNPSVSPGLFQVIEQFFIQMNWSFVGVIFGEGTFGQLGEVYVQQNADKDPATMKIVYTCLTTLKNNQAFNELQLNQFKSCVDSLDKISVVLLWMSIEDGLYVKQYLDSIGADKFTYVLAYVGANRGNTVFGAPEKFFDLSFYVREAVSPAVIDEIKYCFDASSPADYNTTDPYSVRDIIYSVFFCDIINNTQIPVCSNLLEDRQKGNCRCDFLVELDLYNLTVKYIFIICSNCI
jgi:hypothetical protein